MITLLAIRLARLANSSVDLVSPEQLPDGDMWAINTVRDPPPNESVIIA
jgi:hypothetical protein